MGEGRGVIHVSAVVRFHPAEFTNTRHTSHQGSTVMSTLKWDGCGKVGISSYTSGFLRVTDSKSMPQGTYYAKFGS